ncbi:YcxB family protein [Streptomyces sp. NPDC058691]|uniref:YcxB family protein n=1 Tax=Streptomyces sp. NPDC058691 TaxID=3346601 RepID=UPI003657D512
MRSSPNMRRIAVTSLFMLLVGVLTLFSDEPKEWLIYYGIGLPVFFEAAAVRLAVRRLSNQFTEPWTVRLTEESYTLHTAVSQAEVSWDAYRDARELAGFWYLRQVNGASGFFPKRVFDETQQADVAAFFARRLPPVKRAWYRPF